jgi:hypothetical protein
MAVDRNLLAAAPFGSLVHRRLAPEYVSQRSSAALHAICHHPPKMQTAGDPGIRLIATPETNLQPYNRFPQCLGQRLTMFTRLFTTGSVDQDIQTGCVVADIDLRTGQ